MEAFSELNVDGKRVAIERVRELTDIPKYQRRQDDPAGDDSEEDTPAEKA